MIPIQDLLSRIRWDPGFGGEFQVGFYDRVLDRTVVVPLSGVDFPQDDRLAFELLDASGERRRIPFHRIREVYRDGSRIWFREVPEKAGVRPPRS
jgi:uncharacterized protein (UPF0248 family)